MSYAQVRGAILGLALFFGAAGTANAAEFREHVQRWLAGQSYILVESPAQPPRLLLLGVGPSNVQLTATDRSLRQALLDLMDEDAVVREDALLRLADSEADNVTDLIASALADVSPDVRDTAASILEDLSKD